MDNDNKNVIFVDFVNKTRTSAPQAVEAKAEAPKVKKKKAKVMTKGDVHKLSKRVDEINATLDLCHPDTDADVVENLERELSQIQIQLAQSLDNIAG